MERKREDRNVKIGRERGPYVKIERERKTVFLWQTKMGGTAANELRGVSIWVRFFSSSSSSPQLKKKKNTQKKEGKRNECHFDVSKCERGVKYERGGVGPKENHRS